MTRKYKSSTLPFLAEIPETWSEEKLSHICSLKEIINNNDEELLSVYLNKGVIRYSESNNTQVHKPSEDLSKYQLVEPGDLVLNNQQAWRGSVGVSKYRGIVSPAYFVFEFLKNHNVDFLNYLVRSKVMVNQFVIASKGVGSIQRQLYYPNLRNTLFLLPPLDEQKAIADFLDKKTEQIDRFISLQKEAISLLKELRQAEITKAVTKGLDENAEMKDNKITWLSDIPIYWGEKKIKYLFDERVEKGFPTEPLLVSTQSNGVILKSDYESRTVEAMKDLHLLKLVKVGDFVISLRSFQGGIEYSYCQGIISPAYTIMIPNEDIDSGYFKHLAKSSVFIELLKICVTGIREGQNINYEKLKTHYLPVPPMHEQKEIASYLNKKCADIDSAIQNKEALIEKVTEYKTRLISDAVTGKIDVRGGSNLGIENQC